MAALMTVSKAIDDRPKLDGPAVANFQTVLSWAAARSIQFTSWDDLPVVNRKRDEFGLPHFAREFRGR